MYVYHFIKDISHRSCDIRFGWSVIMISLKTQCCNCQRIQILTLDFFIWFDCIIRNGGVVMRLRCGFAPRGTIAHERSVPQLPGLSPPLWLPGAFWDDHGYLSPCNDDAGALRYVYLEDDDRRPTRCELEVYSEQGSMPFICAIIR